MALETIRFDIQDFIRTEQQAGYLEAALEDGDPALIATAIDDIREARRSKRESKIKFLRET
ncbi:DNA-binding protein [Sinorhizobium americanum]|uniref:Uncharacterized protein n=1 Tax=Sinorhizobium americanum TaxID=194963 RepID=A0A1L3LLT2_9HYPH|nr:hypothetical protein [Sinorhizobium americanum]APG91060.1 hypothetical protein SAMCFNEI73_Ch1768 [Sinorhizobium americanum]OAP43654.1 hypothetical protein ATC00_02025 [Sinorhizobium americanum]